MDFSFTLMCYFSLEIPAVMTQFQCLRVEYHVTLKFYHWKMVLQWVDLDGIVL